MDIISEYIVIQCSNCGNFQSKENRNGIEKINFKCFNCGKSQKLKDKRNGGIRLKTWGIERGWSPKDASMVCKEMKKQIWGKGKQ